MTHAGVGAADADRAVAGTKDSYGAIAAQYADRWDRNDTGWTGPLAKEFAGLLPAAGLVADIGCGPGNDTRRLRGLGLRAHGFDLSHEMLAARAVPGQVQADMRALPIKDGALDGIWCIAALLHIPREMVPGVLAQFHRVLRPGGRGVISVAQGEGERWEPVPYANEEQRFFVYHSPEEFAGLLAAAGLEVLETRRHSTHREWMSLHLSRDAGVH